jgi:glucokinase
MDSKLDNRGSADARADTVLTADIGGTRARFGLVDGAGRLTDVQIFECSPYPAVVDAAREYLAGVRSPARPRRGAIAVACPVLEDQVQMTNHPWAFSIAETREQLGLETLEALNDFCALALALPFLPAEDTRTLNPGHPEDSAPLAVLGPGTGLGVSALVPVPGAPVALSTEGGHRDLAASTEREWAIIERLQRRFGRVSAERVLSGPGLVNLHWAIRDLAGLEAEAYEPEDVVRGANEGSCAACSEAVRFFSRQLGAVAGDLALTLGARGGVFVGGGVVPRMGEAFEIDLFREGFLEKGRFRRYLEPIPVRLITGATTALLGAARALEGSVASGVRSVADSPAQ